MGANHFGRLVGGCIANADLAHLEHGVGHSVGRRKGKAKLVLGCQGRHTRHALERLDAALGLTRFGGLGLEAVDEGLQMRNSLLLSNQGQLLLIQLLGAQTLKLGVVAAAAL